MTIRKLLSLIALIAALLAARCFAWAEGAAIRAGELRLVDLSQGAQAFSFTPEADSAWDVCAFPSEGFEDVEAKLYRGDETVAEGSGSLTLFTEKLTAGEAYTLRLTGAGRMWMEVARHALSRCVGDPKPLNAAGDEYAKAIVNPGDAHWYALAPEVSQPLMLTGLPKESGLQLEARLFSASGRLLAEATRTSGGAFLMDFMPRAGRRYFVRVSAAEGGTGLYEMKVDPGAGGLPEALILSEDGVTLMGREIRALTATAIPEGSAGAMLWESSDADVVRVSQDGVLTGLRPGAAVVTAYAAGAVRARCRVEVRRVRAEGVRLITSHIRMNVGDDLALEWSILPDSASNQRVTFAVSPEGVVSVDESGVLRALNVGEAAVTVRTADGSFEDRGVVYVAPARKRYRALLVGEQNYAPGVADVRLGSANSVAGVRSMLGALSYLGTRFEVSTALDLAADELQEAIADAFDGATAQDAALFYITCHGDYRHGMTLLKMSDGSVLTAQELRQALDRVPGQVTLLLDCCGSGGAIGGEAARNILDGVTSVFGGMAGPGVFASSKYRVLASAMVEQDSYRISFDSSAQETRMATLFARAVCEGCGWNIDAAERRAMRADVNYDDVVSLDELYNYARRRVMWYLSLTGSGYVQTVRVWPEGDTSSLFERTEAKE